MEPDISFRSLRNPSKMINDPLLRTITVVDFMDWETLTIIHLENAVPPTPEVGYPCREAIITTRINSIFHVLGARSPADETSKAKPSKMLHLSMLTNLHKKGAFMLEKSPFVQATYITTSSVPMSHYVNDFTPGKYWSSKNGICNKFTFNF